MTEEQESNKEVELSADISSEEVELSADMSEVCVNKSQTLTVRSVLKLTVIIIFEYLIHSQKACSCVEN